MRKQAWKSIIAEESEIVTQLKQRIGTKYFFGQQIKVNSKKRKEMKRLKARSDIQQILTVNMKDDEKDANKKQ